MNKRILTAACLALSTLTASVATSAQDLGKLGGMIPGGGSMTSGSMGNVAGLLQFCMKNNILGGDSGASAVKDQLLGKLGGGSTDAASSSHSNSTSDMMSSMLGGKSKAKTDSSSSSDPTSDAGYLSGAKGILQGSNGKSMDLNSIGGGSSDLKSELTKKACDTVLKQGKSLVGM